MIAAASVVTAVATTVLTLVVVVEVLRAEMAMAEFRRRGQEAGQRLDEAAAKMRGVAERSSAAAEEMRRLQRSSGR